MLTFPPRPRGTTAGGRGRSRLVTPSARRACGLAAPGSLSELSQDTCQAVCLCSFGPNQINWASGSSSSRFLCCSVPLPTDKTSGLSTNYVPKTHGWVFLATWDFSN